METDAKGQLGGLECSDAVRRRIAGESRVWKCISCGKSNEEILKECEEAAKATDVKPDEEVPKELNMGWKDQMGQAGKKDSEDSEGESTQLAEGFVQTTSIATEEAAIAAVSAYPAARPAQGVPQPTATIPLPAQRAPLAPQQQRQPHDGIPAWIDKAIVGLAACLAIMIVKLLLGL